MRPDWLEYHEEAVQLHSGGWSHWLVRGDLIYQDEHLRSAVLDCWSRCMRVFHGRLDVVKPHIYGVPTGGTRWAEALAHRWETEPLSAYEGADAGPTFIVDDVATTGSSLFQYNEPKLVIVRRGPTEVLVSWADMYWLPVFKDKPIS